MKYIFLYILACLFTVNAVAQSIRPTVAVLGDSYSTFEKYIPDTNKTYYTTTDWSKTGVVNVKQTWWWQVIKKAGFKLGANDSYSGATVSYSGYNDEDYADRSFITRVPRLGNPDIILIFGGINDNWANTPIGEYKYEDFKRADLYTYRPENGDCGIDQGCLRTLRNKIRTTARNRERKRASYCKRNGNNCESSIDSD